MPHKWDDDYGRQFRAQIKEDIRPWGKFRAYPHKDAGSLKIITVNPEGTLSLQYHNRRSEYWVVLDDGLEVTVNETSWKPDRGEEIYIPVQARHRLRCVGDQPARIMEIWLGHSEEDDIVRLDDAYGRE